MSFIVEPSNDFISGKDFFIRDNGIFHNGINIETKGPVKSVTKGKILAYRFSKDFVALDDFNTNQIFRNHFHYMGNDFFDTSENIENKNDNYKTYFEKIDSCTAEDVYKLKENLSDNDKIEAFYYLRRIISNSFILIQYDITLLNAETFTFYMLYNHLSPMGRLTCSQKTELIWYDSKLSCKKAKYYYVETNEGIKLPSELVLKNITKMDNTDDYRISWDGYPGLESGTGTIKEKYIRTDLKTPETKRPFRPGIDSESQKSKCLKKEDLKQDEGIIVYTSDSLSSRNVSAILDKDSVFDYVLKDLKKITKTFYPFQISYNGIIGYIYLNETQDYKSIEEWKTDIDKYSNVITNTNMDINLKTCELKICPKEMKNKNGTTFNVEENKIGFPIDFEVDGNETIGYSGFNFMKEEKIGNYNYVAYDKDIKPFNIHIETFVEDEDKLNFDYYKDGILKPSKELNPFFLKIKSGTEIVTTKPSCKVIPATESFEGCIAKVEKGFGYYSNEEFYKLTIYAKTTTVDKNIFIENGIITEWTKIESWYKAIGSNSTPTYNENCEIINDKNISLLPGYIYRVDDSKNIKLNEEQIKKYEKEELKSRHIECLYEVLPQTAVYYIKAEEYLKLKQLKDKYRENYKIREDLNDLVWIKSVLNSTNIYKNISINEITTEKISSDLELSPDSEEFIEYSDENKKTEAVVWMKAKSNQGNYYWIKKEDIGTGNDTASIELISYYDWKKILKKITLSESQKYIVCEPRKIEKSDKCKTKYKEFSYELKKKAIIDCGIKEDLAENILKHNKEGYFFTHVNEWSNNETQSSDLKKLSIDANRIESSLNAYKFFPEVKGKNYIPDNNIFCFMQPYYFLENLRRIATVKAYNPYQDFYESSDEKVKKSMLYVPSDEYWMKKDEKDPKKREYKIPVDENNYIHVHSIGGWEPTEYIKNGTIVKPKNLDNPGFASAECDENGNFIYHNINGVFNEDYLDVRINSIKIAPPKTYRSSGTTFKRHIGIDYKPSDGKPIVSLIHGTVIALGWISSDGLSLLVQRDSLDEPGDKYLYLACHISSFSKNLKEGDRVVPGQIVAFTGGSGTKNSKLIRSGCFGAHLHVSVLRCRSTITSNSEIFKTKTEGKKEYKSLDLSEEEISSFPHYEGWLKDFPQYVDPFNYNTNFWSEN